MKGRSWAIRSHRDAPTMSAPTMTPRSASTTSDHQRAPKTTDTPARHEAAAHEHDPRRPQPRIGADRRDPTGQVAPRHPPAPGVGDESAGPPDLVEREGVARRRRHRGRARAPVARAAVVDEHRLREDPDDRVERAGPRRLAHRRGDVAHGIPGIEEEGPEIPECPACVVRVVTVHGSPSSMVLPPSSPTRRPPDPTRGPLPRTCPRTCGHAGDHPRVRTLSRTSSAQGVARRRESRSAAGSAPAPDDTDTGTESTAARGRAQSIVERGRGSRPAAR